MSTPILSEVITLNNDVIYEIIKQMKDDRHGLYNWLLVNKLWSKMTVSFLWENPFRFCKRNNQRYYSILETYIACFNENELYVFCTTLYDNSFVYYKTPFFEYGKYLKGFKFRYFKSSICAWLEINSSMGKCCFEDYQINNLIAKLEPCFVHLIMRQCQGLFYMDWNLLFIHEDIL